VLSCNDNMSQLLETLDQARASAAQDLAAGSPEELPAGCPSENNAASPLLRRSERVNFGRRKMSPASVPGESRMAKSVRGPRRAGALGEDSQATGSVTPKCAVASLSLTEIELYFGLTQWEAAVQIGCHVRTLQKRCSVLQITWPRHAYSDTQATASAVPKCTVASLSRTEIESYFGLTQWEAAVEIGCHVRTLQKRCSVLQITWLRHADWKLTDDDAANIFRRKFQCRTPKTAGELAHEYDICVTKVYGIWRRKTWIAATLYVFKSTLGPSYFFISLVLGPLNSLLGYVPSSRYIWSLAPKFCFCKNK
jgi:hypothetical protein